MEQRIEGARSKLRKVGQLPLSAMGKGLASSAYATSQVLYLAEFDGMPSSSTLTALGGNDS
jgi:hypothetical protein